MDLPIWCWRHSAGQSAARTGLLMGHEFSRMSSLRSLRRPCCSSGWISSKVLRGAFLPANSGDGKHWAHTPGSGPATDSALGARKAAGSIYMTGYGRRRRRCAGHMLSVRARLRHCQPPVNSAIVNAGEVTSIVYLTRRRRLGPRVAPRHFSS